MAGNLCELCGSRGLKSKLVTRQLNFDEAIVVCENDECVYPLVDLSRVCGNVVKRKASEVFTFKRKKRKKLQKTKSEDSDQLQSLPAEFALVHGEILQWQNRGALCWLDCTMALLVHSRTLAKCLSKPSKQTDSIVNKLVDGWSRAQTIISKNNEDVAAAAVLNAVRDRVWQHLQPIMKCQMGINDSPVAALPLLLRENSVIQEEFSQFYQWEFTCTICGYKQADRSKKCVVTFPNTSSDFLLPNNMFFLRSCYKCGMPGQRSELVYHKQPGSIVLHFLEGLKTTECLETGFKLGSHHYAVSHLIQYQRNPDHFIFWTKEPNGARWMEMDDTKASLCTWSVNKPSVPPAQVHVAVWEKVFDRSQVRNKSVPVDAQEPAECAFGGITASGAKMEPKKQVSRPPPLNMAGVVEEQKAGSLGDFNHNTMTSEDSKNYVNNLPLLPVTRDLATMASTPEHHSSLANNSSEKVWSDTALDTPIATNNLSQVLTSRSITAPVCLPASRPAYELEENNNLQQKKSLNTFESSTVLGSSNLTISVSAPALPVTKSKSVSSKSSSIVCASATGNESCAVKCLQTCGATRVSKALKSSANLLVPRLTKSVSDPSVLNHITRTNSRSASQGVSLLKRKFRAAQFEPYIPGKRKREEVSCPNFPLVMGTTEKNLDGGKLDGSLSLNSPGYNSKKSAFLSWQEVAEHNRKDILTYDSQSDSGYSSPASVSSCSSLAAVSDCGAVDGQTSEIHCSSALPSANTIQQQGVLENKSQSECMKLVNGLEELLIDCFDSTSTLGGVTDSPVEGTARPPIAVSEGINQLSQEDDDFLLELVCS